MAKNLPKYRNRCSALVGLVGTCSLTFLLITASPAQAQSGQGDLLTTIGTFAGPEETLFGIIADVAVDSEGRIIIADPFVHAARIFRSDGSYVGTMGREGPGPGEFRDPYALDVSDAGEIQVLDRGNMKISTYRLEAGSPRFIEDTSLPVNAWDFCAIEGRRYLLAFTEQAIVQEIGAEGQVVNAFAQRERPTEQQTRRMGAATWRLDHQINHARLVCTGTMVIVIHEQIPVVRAFTPDGELLWRVELDDFHPPAWSPSPNGGLAQPVDRRAGARDEVTTVALAPNDLLVITLIDTADFDNMALESRFLRLETGQEIARRPVPIRIVGVRGDSIYGWERSPFSRVEIRRIPDWPM